MVEINLAEFLVSYMQYEYTRYSKLISSLSQHIDRCNEEFIIDNTERNSLLKQINEIIKRMNNIYNERIRKLENEENDEAVLSLDKIINDEVTERTLIKQTKSKKGSQKSQQKNQEKTINDYFNVIKNTNEEDLMEILNINKCYKIDLYNDLYNKDFDEIKNKLVTIVTKVGMNNINNVFDLVIGPCYEKIIRNELDELEKYEVIKSNVIPLRIQVNKIVKENQNKKKQKLSNTLKLKSEETIVIDIEEKNVKDMKEGDVELVIDELIRIKFKIESINKEIVIEGYIKNDSINTNVRTSQISNNFIYNKKKELEDTVLSTNGMGNFKKISDKIDNQKNINDEFKQGYIKNMKLVEILGYNQVTIQKKIETEYEKYLKYTKMTFKNLMNEFNKETNNNIKNMYNIIKLLLLGNDDSINIAGLLYGLTKDKKFLNTMVSEIIYKNLPYNSQIKLRKSSVTIKSELEKIKSLVSDDVDLKKQIIACKNMPAQFKKVAMEKIDEMKSGSSEYYKQYTYVNVLINYPWATEQDTSIFSELSKDLSKSCEYLNTTKVKLDEKVFGHDECKEAIQELIGKWITNPNSIGKAIGLYGPPGVGKTLIAKGLGEALDIPFAQINLGGLEDGCVLSGHSYTYSAAQPGLIVRKMVEAGNSRCIIFFDELDKACAKHGINEIFNVLIHTTDPNTNKHFNDKFFQEVTFPLDKVLFVFSYNDTSKVDKILLDRMDKIEVKPYSIADKLKIVKNFMLKEISEGIGLEYNSVQFKDEDIEYIIENFTFEAGVRELKRKFESMFLKLNLDRIYKRDVFADKDNFSKDNPIILTREQIDKYLNKPNLNIKKIHNNSHVGIINGLYATTSGSGGIIPILIYENHTGTKGKFELLTTGSQGDVMKESVRFAYTTAMELLKDEYKKKFLKEYPYGLHIHTPDGATPKDGPSAGSAFTTAFISRILGKKIRNDIAMTGEIDMNGRISEIGGLQYKLNGAKKAGIKLVFIPKENEKDFIKIKKSDEKLLTDGFEVIMVEHISEIINKALVEEDGSNIMPNKYLK